MSEINSILNEEPGFNLNTNRNDLIAEVLRIVGGPFGQIAGSFIPDQKIERIIAFVEIWKDTIKNIGKEQIAQRIKIEEAADLAEDAISLAARALTDERRQQIASLLKNSLTSDAVSYVGKKKLLWLLGELNDVEIIILTSKDLSFFEQKDFYEKHQEIWDGAGATFGALPERIIADTFLNEYKRNIARLALVDEKQNLTSLGGILLEFLELDKDSRHPVSAKS